MALSSTQSIAATHYSASRDALVAAALLIVCLFVYGRGSAAPPPDILVGDVQAQATALARHGARDHDGRLLPVFVHIGEERWLPAMPILTTAALIKLAPDTSDHARWVATVFGAL